MDSDKPGKALMDCFLTTDRHQRIRMMMAGFASLVMLCCAAIMNLLAQAGLMRIDWTLWWTLATGTGFIATLVLIRSGCTRRLHDPALTQLQIRYALVCNAFAYFLLGPARGIALIVLSLILMFGVFGTSPRQMMVNIVFALLVFGLALMNVLARQEPGYVPELELAYAGMVLLLLAVSAFVSVRLHAIRQRLSRQKQDLTHALQRIHHLAEHDDLTGLVNRRRMAQLMETALQRTAPSLLLALLDIDHFKRINDTHGHAVGDQVLCAFARAVQGSLRSSDVVARWGGEEFVLMLRDTDSADAAQLLERVRNAVAALTVPAPGELIRLTVSIGWAAQSSGTTPAEAIENTLERADQALYHAKAQGRNQIVSYECASACHPRPADAAPGMQCFSASQPIPE
ncbi:GGDEF domain-containing protein [Simplicispira psychrophila]|uniref:GGDEF domain-containing protein n=1 Tax=Simplicispira psychrophila TaxID=80882 RepID=UPI000A055B30|nr:GGDEF domain-containing protein [Simplicispira psychrophila]